MAQTPDKLDTCETVRPQLASYGAGQLNASDAQRIKEHISSCASCAQDVAFARVLAVSAPRLPLATPPADLFAQIAMATYAAPPRRTFREVLLGLMTPVPTRLALGTAFAVSIAALVVLPRLSEKEAVTIPATTPPTVASGTQQPKSNEPVLSKPSQTKPVKVAPPRLTTPSSTVVAKRDSRTLPSSVEKPKTPVINAVAKRAPAVPVVNTPTFATVVQGDNTKSQALPASSSGKSNQVAVHAVHKNTVAPVTKRTTPRISRPITIAATNPRIKHQEETGAEPAEEPDMTRMTKVAMADPSEIQMPDGSANGAAEETSGMKVPARFTLRGARTGLTAGGTILTSRSAREQGNGSGLMSVVQAPVKLD